MPNIARGFYATSQPAEKPVKTGSIEHLKPLSVYCDRLKSVKNAKEAAQIFVSRTRNVFIDTVRSEDQKYAAKLTPADSHFLGESSI